MSKTKHHSPSAAQRREQARKERQQRLHTDQKRQAHSHDRRGRRAQRNNPWPTIGVVLVAVLVIVGIFVYISRQQQTPTTDSATPETWKALTSIDQQTFTAVGNGSADQYVRGTFRQVKDAPPVLEGPNGHPQVFYMGAEYCPYCAGQRWGLITALSRFGTFENVSPLISGEGDVPTYSFYQSTYTSQYVDFVSVEVQDNQAPPAAKPLEELTHDQQVLVNKYDAPPYTSADSKGAFPFVSIGNQIVVSGGTVNSGLLLNHSHADIIKQLQDPNSDIAKSVLGTANYFTAAICSLTNNEPANVCTATPIPGLKDSLSSLAPKVLAPASGQSSVTEAALPDTLAPRRNAL